MRRWSLVLFLTVTRAAAAQAPRITPGGDPSVQNDTIYRLAVNPADYPNEEFVYLLDDGVVRFEPDGRSSRTYRQVIQILNQDGAEAWGEQSFSYSSGSERLTVNWIRVLKPNGEVISPQPAHEQESLAPVAFEAPVYSDEKVRRVTLSGVAPGTLVDWSYTIERVKPLVPGDYYTGWRVTTGRLTRRSRLIVDVPATVKPRISEENVHFKRQEVEGHGRHVYTWATKDVQKIESEPFAATPNTLYVSLDVAAPIEWSDVARWYANLLAGADRYKLTPDLQAQLGEHVRSSKTLDDSLRAVYRWVAQDFRYVSLSLGLGGYLPRLPAQVVESRYGDCKDKATLFIAMARAMGVHAFPVLLSSNGNADSTVPTVQQFDHMIAAIDRPASGRLYLDLTSELTPYTELPPAEEGSFALVIHDDGQFERVVLPQAPDSTNRSEVRTVGELAADGRFTGRYTEIKHGSLQYGLRRAYARTFSKDDVRQVTQALANGVFPGASGDSLALFDGRDLAATPLVAVTVRDAPLVSGSGSTRILTLPQSLPTFSLLRSVPELERHRPRKFPIDVGDVVGPLEIVSELRVTLPSGWTAQLPPGMSETSTFGSYRAEYVQSGRELRITRRISGRRGIAPPDSVDALVAWLRAVSKDNVKFLVLEPGK